MTCSLDSPQVDPGYIFNECIAESQDKKVPLFAASLDVQKVLDVVCHKSLLHKLHDKGRTKT